ncbi:hypothetical protein [Mesorhizobium sp. M1B.F.Ca.ET.045.04.1.1]|uniref:hypothetical protein n=1 Tax=Mesorhizobium sp. M1B.F.Ca.ET.045.04.1.1 TaxID=2493673 RepID=UPI000F74EB36|nr:hypothetical protein [Mesorhizobium sp. M1B.F.Ca.ET.045.04.1.1]AZO29357.1 hypothetical protein EJ071_19520 [Mesorhizobium sp. M1B.F.Ca.ET.045.04.1.1]
MKIHLKFKGPKEFYGVIGYLDLTASIHRAWGKDTRRMASWRHITIGLRSPLLRQPGRLYKDGRARWGWWPLRFGYGAGNVYLGLIYIITTFGKSSGQMEYKRFGPLEWAYWAPYRAYRRDA